GGGVGGGGGGEGVRGGWGVGGGRRGRGRRLGAVAASADGTFSNGVDGSVDVGPRAGRRPVRANRPQRGAAHGCGLPRQAAADLLWLHVLLGRVPNRVAGDGVGYRPAWS